MRPTFRLSTRTTLIACCLTLAVFAGIALSSSIGRSDARKASFKHSSAATIQNDPPRFDVERVSLRPTGFDPSQITRPNKNPFFLIIENRTGLGELTLQMEDEAGKRVNQQEMKSGASKRSWNGIVDLPPGRYTVTERKHKDKQDNQKIVWTLSITINP